MRRAFTLIELLVVIFVVGVLVALAIPAVNSARETARRVVCLDNMKQLSLSLHSYESSHGKLPPALSSVLLHWQAFCLPYIDQNAIYSEVKDGVANGNPYFSPFISTTISFSGGANGKISASVLGNN